MIHAPKPVSVITHSFGTPNHVEIEYPVLTNLPSTVVQENINQSISELVNSLIMKQGFYQDPTMKMVGWYEIKTNERNVLSLVLTNESFPVNAMHGLRLIKSLTFDVAEGKLYQLSDLFKHGSPYISILSDLISHQIKERKIPLLGTFKEIGANQDFYIADKCLVIYYQLYRLCSYSYGFPFFPISVYNLSPFIEPGTPLAEMAGNY